MNAATIRRAFEALGAQDVDPLVALMHPGLEWRGRRTRHFWRPRPSCRGPAEARGVLSSTIEWRARAGDHDLNVDQVEQQRDRFAVAFSWVGGDGARHESAHVVRIEDGRIIAIRDYPNGRRARRALRRPRPLSRRAR